MTLQDKINEELVRISNERSTRERSGKFGSSSLGKCYRAQVFNRLNTPPTEQLEIGTLHMFEAGKIVHDYIQKYYKPEQVEVKMEDEHFIGYADIVEEDCVTDIKSVNPAYFFHGWKDKKKVEFSVAEINANIITKKKNNILQVADYAMRLKKPKIRLVFFSRDLSYGIRVHEWTDLTENWVTEVEEERARLVVYWNKNKETGEMPPEAPRLYDGRECSYCSFRGYCGKGAKDSKIA